MHVIRHAGTFAPHRHGSTENTQRRGNGAVSGRGTRILSVCVGSFLVAASAVEAQTRELQLNHHGHRIGSKFGSEIAQKSLLPAK